MTWRNAIPYDQNEEYMRKLGLSFEIMNELETLGVIKFNSVTGYVATNMKEKNVLIYNNGNVLETNGHQDDSFPIGNVIFTSAGEALSKITDTYVLENYDVALKKYMELNDVTFSGENKYSVFLEGDTVRVIRKNP
jgi:hypothetical protein